MLADLRRHTWPGNVRELRNVMKRGALFGRFQLSPAEATHDDGYPDAEAGATEETPEATTLVQWGENAEREAVLRALESTHWHRGRAAEGLGISYSTMLRRIRKYALTTERPAAAEPGPEVAPPMPLRMPPGSVVLAGVGG